MRKCGGGGNLGTLLAPSSGSISWFQPAGFENDFMAFLSLIFRQCTCFSRQRLVSWGKTLQHLPERSAHIKGPNESGSEGCQQSARSEFFTRWISCSQGVISEIKKVVRCGVSCFSEHSLQPCTFDLLRRAQRGYLGLNHGAYYFVLNQVRK